MTTTPDSPDFRALAQELNTLLVYVVSTHPDLHQTVRRAVLHCSDRARTALATPPPAPPDPSQISDGYHTFEELYEHRHALTLSLMKARPDLFWFSRKHNDGELCFGDGTWFIVGAELPGVGAITYHLPRHLWIVAELTGATELEKGRHWDGHTAADVANRLMAWTITPPPKPPTVMEIIELSTEIEEAGLGQIDLVRAALERWGHG